MTPQGSTVRVLIVDDSEIAARKLERTLEASDQIRVVHRLDSASAIDATMLGGIHVVLMDMWMPGTSGLSAIRALSSKCRVIIVSDSPKDSPIADEALAQGAVAFVSKSELSSADGQARLRDLVRSLGDSTTLGAGVTALVGSTGAPRALEIFIPMLKESQDAIVVLQHLPLHGETTFAEWLTTLGVPAEPAHHGAALRPGRILVAPSGSQMRLQPSRGAIRDSPATVRLSPASPGDVHAPSGDVLLESAAFLGPRCLAVILSGIGNDGAHGARLLEDSGARILVQAPHDCTAPSMPAAALAMCRRATSVPLNALGEELARVARRR